MATFLAHIRVRPGTAQGLEEAAGNLHRLTHEREEGVLRYEYWRGQDPCTFYVLASFADAAAFLSHQASEHHLEQGRVIMDVVEDFRLEWIEPVDGLAPAPRTLAHPGGTALDDNIRDYYERFPVGVAEWWSTVRAESDDQRAARRAASRPAR